MLRPGELHIHDGNYQRFLADPEVGGERKARGLVPRDYAAHPVGHYKGIAPFHAVDFPLIPRSEWPGRIKDKVAAKSQLSDIRLAGNGGQMIDALDQDSVGYCWIHSGTMATMLVRAVNNLPYVRLSAFAPGCLIKNYKDEGGWGAQGVDFITQNGVPDVKFWPEKSMSRSNDTPEMRANAKLHRITEGWVDLQAAQYDRKLSFDQVITLLLSDVPVVGDFNFWSHSVCLIDAVDGATMWLRSRDDDTGKLLTLPEFERAWGVDDPATAGTGVRLINSWTNQWSDRGMGTLSGSKAVPDGAVAPRVVLATAA